MFKNLTNFAAAMKNVTQLGSQMRQMQADLAKARVYGSGRTELGGVNIEMNGLGSVTHVSISPDLLSPDQQHTLEKLVLEAVNQAHREAKQLHIQGIRGVTGGAEFFPGFNELLTSMEG